MAAQGKPLFDWVDEVDSETYRLLKKPTVRVIHAARQILKELNNDEPCLVIGCKWPRSLVDVVASQIEMYSPAHKRLHDVISALNPASANAASLMLRLNPGWRPNETNEVVLDCAFLDGANWNGITLENSMLYETSLDEANLRYAILPNAKANKASFKEADLVSALLVDGKFINADL